MTEKMTAAEALKQPTGAHSSLRCEEYLKALRALGFALVPVCKIPEELLEARRILLDKKLSADGYVLTPEEEARLADVRTKLDEWEDAHQIAWHKAGSERVAVQGPSVCFPITASMPCRVSRISCMGTPIC